MKFALLLMLLLVSLGCGDVGVAEGKGPGPNPNNPQVDTSAPKPETTAPKLDITVPTLPPCEGGDRMCAPNSDSTLLTCNDKGDWVPKDCGTGEMCKEVDETTAKCE